MKLEVFPELDSFIKTVFAQPEHPKKIWRTSLANSLTGGHIPFDCSPGQFVKLERLCYVEIQRRISIIPPRKHRGAGKAQVMLACHLSEVCSIPETVANRIICHCYEYQEREAPCKNPPLQDSTAFRVTKMRMSPAV